MKTKPEKKELLQLGTGAVSKIHRVSTEGLLWLIIEVLYPVITYFISHFMKRYRA